MRKPKKAQTDKRGSTKHTEKDKQQELRKTVTKAV
jgi:hypothetical protein